MKLGEKSGSVRKLVISFSVGVLLAATAAHYLQIDVGRDANRRPEIRIVAALSAATCQASFSSSARAELARLLPYSDQALVTAQLPYLDCVTSFEDVERILSGVDRELGAAGLTDYTVALEFYPDGTPFEFTAWNGGTISTVVSRYTFEPKSKRGA